MEKSVLIMSIAISSAHFTGRSLKSAYLSLCLWDYAVMGVCKRVSHDVYGTARTEMIRK